MRARTKAERGSQRMAVRHHHADNRHTDRGDANRDGGDGNTRAVVSRRRNSALHNEQRKRCVKRCRLGWWLDQGG